MNERIRQLAEQALKQPQVVRGTLIKIGVEE